MTIRNLTLTTAIFLGLALPLAAQDAAPAEQTAQPIPASADLVVATVAGKDITLGHMISLRRLLPEQYAEIPDATLFDSILEQLVSQQALAVQVTQPSRPVRLSLENEERSLLAASALESQTAAAATDEKIQETYDTLFADFEPTAEWNASHILVETEETAKTVVEEISGGKDFAEAAREHSTGPSAPNGGALGWFGAGMMVPEFETAVAALEPGQISAPFQTQFGWHVAKLNEVRETQPPTLDEVRDQIVMMIQQEAAAEIITAAEEAVEIVLPDLSGLDRSALSDTSLISD